MGSPRELWKCNVHVVARHRIFFGGAGGVGSVLCFVRYPNKGKTSRVQVVFNTAAAVDSIDHASAIFHMVLVLRALSIKGAVASGNEPRVAAI